MLTKQEIFNKVRDHLLAQPRPSIGIDNQCLYRAPDGGMCAIGCLLKDDPIIAEMEGKTINELAARNSEIWAFFLENGLDLRDRDICELLAQLQDAHDDASMNYSRDPSLWVPAIKLYLCYVAKRHNLEM